MGRSTRELWAKRVERWKDSGLSTREFAAEMGINPNTLSHWKWKLDKATATAVKRKPAAFVEVVAERGELAECAIGTVTVAADDERFEPLEIVVRDELRIRVPARFDAEALRRLVAALGSC